MAAWKDIPQDAKSIVGWWQRMNDLYAAHDPAAEHPWHELLGDLGVKRLLDMAAKYHADYAIAQAIGPKLDLPVVYRNDSYVIYRLK